jgi:hypothetical protein
MLRCSGSCIISLPQASSAIVRAKAREPSRHSFLGLGIFMNNCKRLTNYTFDEDARLES